MANQVPALVLRLEKGSPLTPAEMDGNLKTLRDFCNGLANLLAVSLNPNGTLKPGALNDPSQLADHFITAVKLASDALSHKTGDVKPTCDTATLYSTVEDDGWLECNGATVSRTVFANLFSIIGVTFGPGDGVNTFTLPDLRRRTLVGSGGGATATLGNTVGSVGGEETHTLSVPEIPGHSHTVSVSFSGSNDWGMNTVHSGGNPSGTIGGTAGNTGGGQAHNNIQPSCVIRFLVKT